MLVQISTVIINIGNTLYVIRIGIRAVSRWWPCCVRAACWQTVRRHIFYIYRTNKQWVNISNGLGPLCLNAVVITLPLCSCLWSSGWSPSNIMDIWSSWQQRWEINIIRKRLTGLWSTIWICIGILRQIIMFGYGGLSKPIWYRKSCMCGSLPLRCWNWMKYGEGSNCAGSFVAVYFISFLRLEWIVHSMNSKVQWWGERGRIWINRSICINIIICAYVWWKVHCAWRSVIELKSHFLMPSDCLWCLLSERVSLTLCTIYIRLIGKHP